MTLWEYVGVLTQNKLQCVCSFNEGKCHPVQQHGPLMWVFYRFWQIMELYGTEEEALSCFGLTGNT